MKRFTCTAIPILWITTIVEASEQTSNASTSGLFQIVFGLLMVLGLMAAAAWALKYFGIKQIIGGTNIRVIGGVNVGTRERILIVEAADQWIVVGVTPGCINALATMPKQDTVPTTDSTSAVRTFPEWLKQTLEKRNEK
jgi:flagellar protein FliO/FliZ